MDGDIHGELVTKSISEEEALAEEHLRSMMWNYVALMGQPGINVGFTLTTVISPLVRRWDKGERSKVFFSEIMELK